VKARRRRGLLLLAVALASGGLAASQVSERERSVEERVGPLVPVVVAARELSPDQKLLPVDLALRRVPARFVPPDALGAPESLVGARTAAAVASGGYVTSGVLEGAAAGRGGTLRPGERAVEIAVGGGSALGGAGEGSRVDVVVSTRPHEGAGRTFVALEDVELLGLRANRGAESYEGADAGATGEAPVAAALATLRVTLRQAVYLAAAENFGHEVRLLVRPPGDRRRRGRWSVAEGEL
jgi:pilus assembly protein CpaB